MTNSDAEHRGLGPSLVTPNPWQGQLWPEGAISISITIHSYPECNPKQKISFPAAIESI